jgi:hypothetical protein
MFLPAAPSSLGRADDELLGGVVDLVERLELEASGLGVGVLVRSCLQQRGAGDLRGLDGRAGRPALTGTLASASASEYAVSWERPRRPTASPQGGGRVRAHHITRRTARSTPVNALPAARRRMQRIAAAGCALVAVGYLLTGTGLIAVTADQPPGAILPLLIAAALFGALALGSLRGARRGLWIAGAALQMLVIAGYVAVAAERTPPYEVWGVTLKVLQVALLVVFGWLVIRRESGEDVEVGAASPRYVEV